ncbi:MAG: DUF979 domain-containing protein [Lachnospirales bacterium]
MVNFFTTIAPEIFYVLCGLVSLDTAFRALKNEEAKYGTFTFWLLVAIIFIFGAIIPPVIVGISLCVMGVLTATKQVKVGVFKEAPKELKQEASNLIGNNIFVPAVSIGVVALILSFVKIDGKSLSGAVMIGVACVVALCLAIAICKPNIAETRENTSRLLMQVGAAAFLPQLLGALGTVFTEAGVGDVISGIITGAFPSPGIITGIVLYCFGMVIFTMIMGNAFAAFSVITVGIGIPFVIAQGGNPSIVGVLGMTCGYCGTLLTPMAANFNIVPCAVLETKGKWTVIKAQAPMAILLIFIHIGLMYVLAF